MDGTEIHDEQTAQLATAYAAAHYFVTIGHREWLFGVGQLADDIERELGADHYLFITAWNPASNAATVAQNMAADEHLQARIREGRFRHCSSLGSNAQGGAVEYGWLVLDVPVETGDAWRANSARRPPFTGNAANGCACACCGRVRRTWPTSPTPIGPDERACRADRLTWPARQGS